MSAKEQLLQELPQLTEDLASQVLTFLRSARSEWAQDSSEAALLRQVNLGFSADWWTTYRKLIAQRQAERISEADLVRLVEMSEAVERANVPKIQALRKLAAMRGCAIDPFTIAVFRAVLP